MPKIIGTPIPNIPWQDKPAGCREPVWRYSGNPIIGRDGNLRSNSVFNSAVVPFRGKFAGVFRCDSRSISMDLFAGFSEDGIHWKINDEHLAMTGADEEILRKEYRYDARITPLEGKYYITWCNGYHGPTIGVAWTEDFQTFHQYAQHDNIPSPQFQRFNASEDEEGRLWMANAKGLVVCTKENRSLLTDSLRSKVFIDRYTIDRKEQITNPFSVDSNTIRIGWNFGTDELVIMPMLLDYSAHQSQRYYEWSLDGGEPRLCYEGNPIALKDLNLGTHRIRIALAGHPETALDVEVKVWPSIKFYGMLFVIVSMIIMAVMVMQILKRRKQYHKILKQKHQIELELASHNAVRLHIQRQEQEQAKVEEERRQEKADKMKYRSSEYKELKAKVKAYMEAEKPYLNKNLRITEVADKVGSNAGTLSLMFNDYMHTNYFDFINRYRIDHFKKLALDPDYAQYTVLAISEMCGLKRSSFFNVFKKFEGCTPSEWIKKTKES